MVAGIACQRSPHEDAAADFASRFKVAFEFTPKTPKGEIPHAPCPEVEKQISGQGVGGKANFALTPSLV
jgi:hypothetical protein